MPVCSRTEREGRAGVRWEMEGGGEKGNEGGKGRAAGRENWSLGGGCRAGDSTFAADEDIVARPDRITGCERLVSRDNTGDDLAPPTSAPDAATGTQAAAVRGGGALPF